MGKLKFSPHENLSIFFPFQFFLDFPSTFVLISVWFSFMVWDLSIFLYFLGSFHFALVSGQYGITPDVRRFGRCPLLHLLISSSFPNTGGSELREWDDVWGEGNPEIAPGSFVPDFAISQERGDGRAISGGATS